MNIEQIVKHFGSKAHAAAELGKSIRCIDQWDKSKKIPYWSQLAIQALTNNKLKADKK